MDNEILFCLDCGEPLDVIELLALSLDELYYDPLCDGCREERDMADNL